MVLRQKNGQDPQKQRARAEEGQAALQGLQMPEEQSTEEQTELLRELSEYDLLDEIDDQALRNLATKDIPTSNFSEEQAQEFRAYMEVALLKKRGRHPHPGQDVTGTLREWVHDDPNAGLEPIDRGDLLEDETFAQSMKARVDKARDGSLARLVLSSIRQSIVRRENNDGGGGRLLSRLKN